MFSFKRQVTLNQMNICLNNYSEQNILVVLVNPFPGEEFTYLPHGSNTAQVHVNLSFFDYLSHKLSNSQFVLVVLFYCLRWLVSQAESKFYISHCMNLISSCDFNNKSRIIVSENRYFRLRETF